MILRSLLALLASLWLTAEAHARQDRLTAFYPEGPLLTGDGGVLFAEMHKDRVMRWDADGTASVFYAARGCGPTSIAPYHDGYAVLCHIPNEVHLVTAEGSMQKRITRDMERQHFLNPNDASADDVGGVYFSASGPFRRADQPSGALIYLAADGTLRRLADKLTYSNGVHVDTRTQTLFVSEHLGPRVLAYPILGPGRLGRPAVFKNFASEIITPVKGFPLPGPDGLETDANGNLYVAYYGAGLLFILSPRGEILHRLSEQEPLITNVAVSADGRTLILTGSEIAPRLPYPGSVRRIANPLIAPSSP